MSARLNDSHAGVTGRRTALVVIAAVVTWQILSINLSDFFVAQARDGDPEQLQTALWWDQHHPAALAQSGANAIRQEQPAAALPLLQAAIAANPADARPQMDVAALYLADDNVAQGDRLATVANTLMPVQYAVQLDLAVYWSARENIEQAVQHLATALVGNQRGLRESYFPQLLGIAAQAQTQGALLPITENPSIYPWWEAFFKYAASNAENVATVTALVEMREASTQVPLSARERDLYIGRLRKDELIAEAYLYWVNGLDKEDMQYLGYVFDGGFEREIVNKTGFEWRASPPKNSGIRITSGDTYGSEGDTALRVSFSGKRIRFRHLSQNLYLSEGTYAFSGRVRPDTLKARRGLQWRVDCNAGARGLLGNSDTFAGTGDWRDFVFDITVPADCVGQVLTLRSVGTRDVDHEIEGTLWVDALRIERKR
ncbi:hypothetical protein [Candidatus Marimicrobium litorale]|uniref:Tetratricopeptide repeat protein n=1 Tax=Candidatus Marimicrobium litorale TaxID=2518991 RepID=A0ABT3T559_9GAMM|nr:hypothetical protein [Candidatus Marimicrobium litorale]MCX2977408.1 hypothetical protein [Candidatus Marimicrobium litorale]